MYPPSDLVDALILADVEALIPYEGISDGIDRLHLTSHALLHRLDKSKIDYAKMVEHLVSRIPGGVRPAQRPTLQNTYFNLVTTLIDPLYQQILAQCLDVEHAAEYLARMFPEVDGDLSTVAERLSENWLMLPLDGLRIPVDEIVNAVIRPGEGDDSELEQRRHELGHILAAPWEDGGSMIQLMLVSLLSSMTATTPGEVIS